MQLIVQLYRDDRAFVISSELILVATIVVIGLIVGLVTFRDSLVQELGDSGAAVGAVDQSYSITVNDGANSDATVGPVIDEDAGVVTIRRDFQLANPGPPPAQITGVSVEATFNNFGYTDNPDLGDVPDPANQPPAGILLNVAPGEEGP